MEAIFYTTSKRHNSTLRPTGGVSMEVYLKENTNLINPTFIIESNAIPAYSMMFYAGRYYFISSYSSISANAWEVNCVCDVLASYAEQIKATTAFVMFSSSDYDLNLYDSRIINTLKMTAVTNSVELPGWNDSTRYFLATVGHRIKRVSGFVDYYVLSSQQLTSLSNVFYDNTDFINEVKQLFAQPFDTIVSCKAGRINPSTDGSVEIYLGAYATGVNGSVLAGAVESHTVYVEVPWLYTDFRRLMPFTQIYLFLPYVGMIPIAASQIVDSDAGEIELGSTQLSILITLDFVTGEIIYKVRRFTGQTIGIYSGQFLYDIPVSQIQPNTGAVLTGISEATLALASGYATHTTPSVYSIGGGVTNIVGGMLARTPSVMGGTGGAGMSDDAYKNIQVFVYYCDTRNDMENMRAIAGNMNMKVRQIEGLTGYCQTSGFSVSGAMTDTERNQINQMMDGGVYIE